MEPNRHWMTTESLRRIGKAILRDAERSIPTLSRKEREEMVNWLNGSWAPWPFELCVHMAQEREEETRNRILGKLTRVAQALKEC